MTKDALSGWCMVIPARLKSTRLPNKPLQVIQNKPLVAHVFDNMRSLKGLGAKLVVGADSPEVAAVCREYNMDCIMTDPDLPSGTDRAAAASQTLHLPFVMNIQGDEPFLKADDVRDLALGFQKRQDKMGTLIYRSTDTEKFANPNTVKVVLDKDNYGIYFSRAGIPYHRDQMMESFWQHIGVYAFRKESIREFCGLQTREIENKEKLEQLRAIQAGWKIWTSVAKQESWGIDTPQDLDLAKKLMK